MTTEGREQPYTASGGGGGPVANQRPRQKLRLANRPVGFPQLAVRRPGVQACDRPGGLPSQPAFVMFLQQVPTIAPSVGKSTGIGITTHSIWRQHGPINSVLRPVPNSSAFGSVPTPNKGGVHDACKKHSVRIGRNHRPFGLRRLGVRRGYGLQGSGYRRSEGQLLRDVGYQRV